MKKKSLWIDLVLISLTLFSLISCTQETALNKFESISNSKILIGLYQGDCYKCTIYFNQIVNKFPTIPILIVTSEIRAIEHKEFEEKLEFEKSRDVTFIYNQELLSSLNEANFNGKKGSFFILYNYNKKCKSEFILNTKIEELHLCE